MIHFYFFLDVSFKDIGQLDEIAHTKGVTDLPNEDK